MIVELVVRLAMIPAAPILRRVGAPVWAMLEDLAGDVDDALAEELADRA